MKCVVLAAGYATRMGELTKNRSKCLLPLGGKPAMSFIFDKIEEIDEIDQVYLVSNARFFNDFENWLGGCNWTKPVEILNDGSTNNDNRLGSIGDLYLAIREYGINEDLMVMAGDRTFDWSLNRILDFYKNKGRKTTVTILYDPKIDLRLGGVVEVDDNLKVIGFEEKPKHPKGKYYSVPIYVYLKETIPLIGEYTDSGNNKDAPGNLVAWLYPRIPVYACLVEGITWDLGNPNTYREANAYYNRLKSKL